MNLDKLLENAFERLSRESIVIETDDDIVRLAPKDGVPIFKMHGSFDNKECRVLSLKDYEHFDTTRHTMKAILLSYITQYPMLVIGAGLSDPNFLRFNGIVHQVHGGFKNQVFYLHPRLPSFVEDTWGTRRFQFIDCDHDDITTWLEALMQGVDEARQKLSENKGPYYVNRFLKERALEALGGLLHDYDALQLEYTASIHMRDYGWFSKSWEDTLYLPLADKLLDALASTGIQDQSLLYVGPGPHAPVLSKAFQKNSLSHITLMDIDGTALSQAHQRISASSIASSIEILQLDLTNGVGKEFLEVLSKAIDLPYQESVALLTDTSWLKQIFQAQIAGMNKLTQPILKKCQPFNFAYSEMVAAFTVTPVLLAFRSRLYSEVKKNRYSAEEAADILSSVVNLWREYNFQFFKFHLAMLTALLSPGGVVMIAVDTAKIYDDDKTEKELTFSINPARMSTHDLGVIVKSNKNLYWRDHDYGFTTYVHGVAVPDFKPHRHEISVITYSKDG